MVEEPTSQQVLKSVKDLMCRTDEVLDEVRRLLSLIEFRNPNKTPSNIIPGLQTFLRELLAEKASIQRLLDRHNEESTLGKMKTQLSAANTLHHEARWDVVKRRKGLVGMLRSFPRYDKWALPIIKNSRSKGVVAGLSQKTDQNYVAECDAVVDGGAEWIKVVSANHRRLIQQVAEAGLCIDDEDGHEEEDPQDFEEEIVIFRTVRHLVEAARANPWKLRMYPRIRLVFTKIEEGKIRELDWILNKIRNMSKADIEILVDCANGDFLNSPIPDFEEALENLVKQPPQGRLPTSDILNLDCNVLLGYISDITNTHCEIKDTYAPEKKQYISLENAGEHFVPELHDQIAGHQLVCTRSVFDNFRDISSKIGTATEQTRYRLIVPYDELNNEDKAKMPSSDMSSAERVAELRKLCQYPVPANLILPIHPIERDWNLSTVQDIVDKGGLPRYAVSVVKGMGTANIQTLVYGWYSGYTTLTGQFTFVDRFLSLIQLYSKEYKDVEKAAPDIIKIKMFRSLLANPRPAHIPPPPRRTKYGSHWRNLDIVPPELMDKTEGVSNK